MLLVWVGLVLLAVPISPGTLSGLDSSCTLVCFHVAYAPNV